MPKSNTTKRTPGEKERPVGWKKKRRDSLTKEDMESLEKTKERTLKEIQQVEEVAEDIDFISEESGDSQEAVPQEEDSLMEKAKRFLNPSIPSTPDNTSRCNLELLTYDAWDRIDITERNLMILYPWITTVLSKGQNFFNVFDIPPHQEDDYGIPGSELTVTKKDYYWDFKKKSIRFNAFGTPLTNQISHDIVTRTSIDEHPIIVKLVMIAMLCEYNEMESYIDSWKQLIKSKLTVDKEDDIIFVSKGININMLLIRNIKFRLDKQAQRSKLKMDIPKSKVYYFLITMVYNTNTETLVNHIRNSGAADIGDDPLESITNTENHLLELANDVTRVMKKDFFTSRLDIGQTIPTDMNSIYKLVVKDSVTEGFERDHPHIHVMLELSLYVPSNVYISYDLKSQVYPKYLKEVMGCNYVNVTYHRTFSGSLKDYLEKDNLII